jgi:diphthine synthase
MFYIIGLGLDKNSLDLESLEVCKNTDKIYLENYTVDFPYSIKEIEKNIKKILIPANRDLVENESFIEEAKKEDIVLLVYGSPLIATTHTSLILKCKKEKIPYKIIHNASVFDAITETGLHLYKFGKTISLPKWQKNFQPKSFIDVIKQNKKINAHTLLLVDIGLGLKDAIKQLEDSDFNKIHKEKIILCSCLGTKNSEIFYDNLNKLKNKIIKKPYCLVIPSELHFSEKEFINQTKK